MTPAAYGVTANVLTHSLPRSDGMRAYAFGSTSASKTPQDIDLLLVYPRGRLDDGHWVAELIRAIPHDPPFDVIALNVDEETETGFIRREGAQLIWNDGGC